MKKILICAVPFSDNLGDGVIAASLAHIAGLKYPDAKVEFLDIAGRHGFDEQNLRGGGAFGIFQKMPALVCAGAFAQELSPDKKWDVGICVSSLDALVMNSEYEGTRASGSADFFSNLADSLRAEGARILYFTNGAAEDNRVLAEISSRPAAEGTSFLVPKRPDDLVELISACSCIAAHRLHANIVAYSLNIPSVGMNWDKKVESFFRLTGRTQYLFDLSPRADDLKASVLNLLNEKNPDRRRLDELKGEVIAGTHALI